MFLSAYHRIETRITLRRARRTPKRNFGLPLVQEDQDMTKFAIAVLAAVTLAQPALSVAGDKPSDTRAKPASFVPHTHTHHHVYGAPIQPAIVGHAKTSHRKQAPKR
jgi:hypothetical protein